MVGVSRRRGLNAREPPKIRPTEDDALTHLSLDSLPGSQFKDRRCLPGMLGIAPSFTMLKCTRARMTSRPARILQG